MCVPPGESHEHRLAGAPSVPEPAPFRFDLGDVTVVPLVEIERLLIDPDEFFPDRQGAENWCLAPPWFAPDSGHLVFAIQCFLVLAPGRVVLVDGCVGAAKSRSRPAFHNQPDHWLTRFAATGLAPEEVTDVVLTHLHVDHVGWATRYHEGTWVPAFGRARHHVTRAELDYWTGPHGRAAMLRTGDYFADSIQPIIDADLLDLTAPDAAIGDHIELIPAAGHTPGNVCVRVRGSQAQLLITGDVLHHPLQLADPRLNTRYCVDPTQAAVTRAALLSELADSTSAMLPSHFAAPSAGRITPQEGGYAFRPAWDLIRHGQYRGAQGRPPG